MSNFYAAVDGGVSSGVRGTGAVYGVGTTPNVARAAARANGADGSLDVVECSDQAAMWIGENDGAPSREINVGSEGEIRLGESESEDRAAIEYRCEECGELAIVGSTDAEGNEGVAYCAAHPTAIIQSTLALIK